MKLQETMAVPKGLAIIKHIAADHPQNAWQSKVLNPLHNWHRTQDAHVHTQSKKVHAKGEHAHTHYMPGLDGLRALAVLAVIAYHLGLSFAPGGLLGVDVFFVLSGYLITDILIAQWRADGRMDLKDFWLRRARRLLPGLYVMLVAVVAWVMIMAPSQLAALRAATVAAFLYVSNWWLIFHHVSYFAQFGPPSPLGHLWSLAVEEQFYLLWPLLLVLGLRFVRRRGWLLTLIVAAAAASSLLMAFLYQPGGNPNRVYYGTDTRAFSLLIGAALALVWASRTLHKELTKGKRMALDLCGLVALVVVIGMIITTNEYQPFLYQGGMVMVSLASAVVVAVLAHPASKLAWLFGKQPLRFLGVRSYGIYLWHYPIIVLTTPSVDTGGFDVQRAVLQVAASILLADLSWRFVEMPIRRGAIGRLWAQAKSSLQEPVRPRIPYQALASLMAVALLCGGVVGDLAHSQESAAASTLPADRSRPLSAGSNLTDSKGKTHAMTAHSSRHRHPDSSKADAPLTRDHAQHGTEHDTRANSTFKKGTAHRKPPVATVSAAERAHRWEAALGRTTTSIGDSIMIDMQPYLPQFLPGIWVDGDVGRQMISLPAAVAQLKADGKLRSRLIIELGTNGPFDEGQLVAFLRSLDEKEIILANTRVPRPWQNEVNAMLAQVARAVPHTTLVNWYLASANHNDYFYPDGVHLNPLGARVYAALLAHALEAHAKNA